MTYKIARSLQYKVAYTITYEITDNVTTGGPTLLGGFTQLGSALPSG